MHVPRYLAAVFLVITCFSSAVTRVAAQESNSRERSATDSAVAVQVENPINLTVSPITLFFQTDPGVQQVQEIRIRNNNTELEKLSIEVGTFEADRMGSSPQLRDVTSADLHVPWLSLSETEFLLQPNEWKSITVTFSPPAEASLSYYYSLIISRSDGAVQTGQTVIQGAPALLVLATVDSPFAERKLEVVSFAAKRPFVEYLPQEFEVVIRNTGNVHLAPTGNIFVDGMGSKDIAVLSLNPKNSMVLPNTERTFSVVWDDGFPVYTLDAEGKRHLTWDFTQANSFRLGQFAAQLLMVYDDGTRDIPVSSQIEFWVFPWKLALLFLIPVVLAGVGVYAIVRLVLSRRKNDA